MECPMPDKPGSDPSEASKATEQRAEGGGDRLKWARGTAALAIVAMAGAVSCGELGGLGAGAALCPELGGGNALSANFDANARVNAKVRAFVQASKDMA